jgi:hypothetical protein
MISTVSEEHSNILYIHSEDRKVRRRFEQTGHSRNSRRMCLRLDHVSLCKRLGCPGERCVCACVVSVLEPTSRWWTYELVWSEVQMSCGSFKTVRRDTSFALHFLGQELVWGLWVRSSRDRCCNGCCALVCCNRTKSKSFCCAIELDGRQSLYICLQVKSHSSLFTGVVTYAPIDKQA